MPTSINVTDTKQRADFQPKTKDKEITALFSLT